MTPRHAAALALIGCYLMAPPYQYGGGSFPIDVHASRGDWFIMGAYDTAASCMKAEADARDAQSRDPRCKSKLGIDVYLCVRQLVADCIASDDPRLAR